MRGMYVLFTSACGWCAVETDDGVWGDMLFSGGDLHTQFDLVCTNQLCELELALRAPLSSKKDRSPLSAERETTKVFLPDVVSHDFCDVGHDFCEIAKWEFKQRTASSTYVFLW